MAQRSWLVAAAVAVAVLAVVAGSVALTSGGAENPNAGSDVPGSRSGDASGGGSPGHGGTAMPSAPPVDPPARTPTPLPHPSDVAPRDEHAISHDAPLAVPVQSYELLAPDRLRLRYTTGVPECYGRLDHPVVDAAADRVVVTLVMSPPTAPASRPCPEIALVEDVVVELAAPLGDRAVVDGVTRRPVRRGHAPG